jgi:pantoate--beta-alanine ligase
MEALRTVAELRKWRAKQASGRIGFVPTMGALHSGHLSLLNASVARSETTIASIFVNPAQFGPNEDLANYPRTEDADLASLEAQGAAAAFIPSVEEMYPPGFSTTVVETELSKRLCGPFRPGHFRGVATVVVRLLNLVRPDAAFFGQKDYQQALIVSRVVSDLGIPVEVSIQPTVREPDGLAMSSRNRYLTLKERAAATLVYRSLQAAFEAAEAGEREAESLQRIGRAVLSAEEQFTVDYWEVADRATLLPVEVAIPGQTLLATAGRIGQTRLIDNLLT